MRKLPRRGNDNHLSEKSCCRSSDEGKLFEGLAEDLTEELALLIDEDTEAVRMAPSCSYRKKSTDYKR